MNKQFPILKITYNTQNFFVKLPNGLSGKENEYLLFNILKCVEYIKNEAYECGMSEV